MSENSSSHVKIYDRPERKTLSPFLIIALLLILSVAGYFTYRAFTRPLQTPTETRTGAVTAPVNAPQTGAAP